MCTVRQRTHRMFSSTYIHNFVYGFTSVTHFPPYNLNFTDTIVILHTHTHTQTTRTSFLLIYTFCALYTQMLTTKSTHPSYVLHTHTHTYTISRTCHSTICVDGPLSIRTQKQFQFPQSRPKRSRSRVRSAHRMCFGSQVIVYIYRKLKLQQKIDLTQHIYTLTESACTYIHNTYYIHCLLWKDFNLASCKYTHKHFIQYCLRMVEGILWWVGLKRSITERLWWCAKHAGAHQPS